MFLRLVILGVEAIDSKKSTLIKYYCFPFMYERRVDIDLFTYSKLILYVQKACI